MRDDNGNELTYQELWDKMVGKGAGAPAWIQAMNAAASAATHNGTINPYAPASGGRPAWAATDKQRDYLRALVTEIKEVPEDQAVLVRQIVKLDDFTKIQAGELISEYKSDDKGKYPRKARAR